MSWPTRTWTINGWKDFKTPGRGKPDELFPDDWRHHKSGVDNSNYWDLIDNPLYEAAAIASGIDWDRFVSEATAALGTKEDYQAAVNYVNDYRSSSGMPGMGGATAFGMHFSGGFGGRDRDDAWDDLTPEQQAIANNLPDPSVAVGGIGSMMGGNHPLGATGIGIAGLTMGGAGGPGGLLGALMGMKSGDGEDAPKDWGFNRDAYGAIAEDLDTMYEWLTKTIKTHSLQDMPIVDRGPQGSDYGIDGDIWAHYGLDKPPAPPKAMDVNYEFNLISAKPSTATYSTPEGYPTLDMSGESVAYGDTHYAKWQAEEDKAYDKWEAKWGDTSYGETSNQTHTT